jgi:uncharacterized membrane protein YqjE
MAVMDIKTSASPTASDSGIVSSVRHVLTAAGRYAGARTKLFLLESRAAARDSTKALLFYAVAAAGGFFGGLLLTAALVVWIAQQWLQGNYAAACAFTGLTFLAVAALLVRRARRALQAGNFFPVTKAELHRDKQWL